MSNCQRFEVPHLEFVGWHLVSASLRTILHTIVFTRSFERTEPQERYEEDIDVHFVAIKDADTEHIISKRIQEFIQWLQKRPVSSGMLRLAFYDKPQNKVVSMFESPASCWEEWTISVTVTDREETVSIQEFSQKVKGCIEHVLRSVIAQPCPLPVFENSRLNGSFKIWIVMENKASKVLHVVHKALQDINTTSLLR